MSWIPVMFKINLAKINLVNLGKIDEATRLAQKAKKDNLHRDLIQKLNDLTASQTISGSQKSAQETEYELRVLYDQGQLEQVIAQAAIHIKRGNT